MNVRDHLKDWLRASFALNRLCIANVDTAGAEAQLKAFEGELGKRVDTETRKLHLVTLGAPRTLGDALAVLRAKSNPGSAP